jgi:hypothetical protein
MALITGKGIIEGRGVLAQDPALKIFRAFDVTENGRVLLWQDATGTETPVSAFLDLVGAVRDVRNGSLVATQPDSNLKPRWRGVGNGIRFDRSNDVLQFDFNKAFDGYLVVGTKTASYVLRVQIPSGNYNYGRWELFDVVALEFYESFWSDAVPQTALEKIIERGASPTSGFSTVTNLDSAWRERGDIIKFPLINTSNVTNFSNAWRSCINLIEFPEIDTSKATNLSFAWFNCPKLTSFFEIDTSNVTNFSSTWFGCQTLSSFFNIDVSKATSLNATWQDCRSFSNFPLINTLSITSFTDTWRSCPGLTTFPLINTSNALTLSSTWRNCTGLLSFPLINTSNVTNMEGAWRFCNSLAEFPEIDTSKVTNMDGTWLECRGLIVFPEINTSNVTSMRGTWANCVNLIAFPEIDTSKVTSFNLSGFGAWGSCASLLEFPLIDTSEVVDFGNAWRSCVELTEFPQINTSKATSFNSTWFNCNKLTSFPEVDASNVTDLAFAWSTCRSLTSFPSINISKATNLLNAWASCSGLTSFPTLDTSKATNAARCWFGCTSLTSFPALDFSSIAQSAPNVFSQGLAEAWRDCVNLTQFPANVFDNCPTVNFTDAFRNCGLNQQSVDNILISINAANKSNGRLDIILGNSAPPSAAGLAAQQSLQSRGWIVNVPEDLILPESDEVPFEEEAFSFLDVFKLYYEGFQFNDPIEVWPNLIDNPDGDASQSTTASQPVFLVNANSTRVPGLLFDGLTTVHYELGDAWKLPPKGPWTMYFALRRNNSATRLISSWTNAAANNNIAYAVSHVSTGRTNYSINNIFSGNIPLQVNNDAIYSFVTNQRRVLSITKREDNGYTVCIDNLLLYQTDTDGTITTPTVQPLLGARWDATGLVKELFLHSTMLGIIGYNTAHDATKRDQVFDFLFDRYQINPPHIENKNTSIAEVLDLDQRGNWINADTGTTATDLSTYSKNGTYQNGVTLGQPPLARFGESALFTAASNQYISDIGSVGDYNFMRATNVWTFGAWIRPVAGLLNYQLLLSTTTSTDDVGVWIGIDKSNLNRQMRVDICGPTGQQLNIRSFNGFWTNNLTTFVTVVSNGSTISFYQDCQLMGQTAITATTTTDDHSSPLALAGPQQGYYNGSMQLAFVSNRALTQTEIIDIYASTRLEL